METKLSQLPFPDIASWETRAVLKSCAQHRQMGTLVALHGEGCFRDCAAHDAIGGTNQRPDGKLQTHRSYRTTKNIPS